MSVAVVLISHHPIGQAFINAVTTTFGGHLPLPLTHIDVPPDADPDTLLPELQRVIDTVTTTDGVLILSDVFGATPCNIGRRLRTSQKIRQVSGLNLPMLLRVMNYPEKPLDELCQTAAKGGREGILICPASEEPC